MQLDYNWILVSTFGVLKTKDTEIGISMYNKTVNRITYSVDIGSKFYIGSSSYQNNPMFYQ